LQRSAVEQPLTRFQNVVAGKFAADFTEKLHSMMKEHSAYDNLSPKQSPEKYLFIAFAFAAPSQQPNVKATFQPPSASGKSRLRQSVLRAGIGPLRI
jgi:hypothetical protein